MQTNHQTAPSSSPEASSNGSAPLRVIAKYKFIGRCNDELTFEKNDIITVTQQLDGGWWEGALNGQVGWFPADYIGIIKTSTDPKHAAQRNGVAKDASENLEASRLAFRKEVITAYLTQEKQHIAHLLRICRDFLDHIKFDKILTPSELSTLSANISDIVHFKEHLVSVVEEAITKDLATQRIGGIFLNAAPEFKALLKTYCENHPLAVDLINRKRDLLQKSLATRKLDLKDLISGLSLVFRHVSKYAISLQEIERNTPEAHADRGNLQRAAAVYRDISNYCTFLRKQKEIQLEFLSTAHLEEWLGKDFEKVVGPLIYVGPVTVSASEPSGKEDDVVTDRCFALFARSILLLELSPERNNYVLRDRIATTDLVVQKNDSKMSFSLRKGKRFVIAMNALTKEDYQQTSEALSSCPAISFDESFSLQNVAPISPQRIGEPRVQRITETMPSMRAEIAQLPQAQKPQLAKKPSLNASTEFRLNHQLEMILPEGLEEEKAPVPPHANIRPSSGGQSAGGPRGMLYSGWCLRPYAAPRGEYFGATSTAIKMRKGLSAEEQDDASLLKVIEGYCTSGGQGANTSFSGRGRGAGAMSSSAMSGVGQRRAASYPEELRPQLIVAEDEKIFVEEVDGEQVVVKERSLVDTVYALKDQLAALQKEVMSMAKTLDKEQKARRRLEEIVRRSSQHVSVPSTPKPMDLPPEEE